MNSRNPCQRQQFAGALRKFVGIPSSIRPFFWHLAPDIFRYVSNRPEALFRIWRMPRRSWPGQPDVKYSAFSPGASGYRHMTTMATECDLFNQISNRFTRIIKLHFHLTVGTHRYQLAGKS